MDSYAFQLNVLAKSIGQLTVLRIELVEREVGQVGVGVLNAVFVQDIFLGAEPYETFLVAINLKNQYLLFCSYGYLQRINSAHQDVKSYVVFIAFDQVWICDVLTNEDAWELGQILKIPTFVIFDFFVTRNHPDTLASRRVNRLNNPVFVLLLVFEELVVVGAKEVGFREEVELFWEHATFLG